MTLLSTITVEVSRKDSDYGETVDSLIKQLIR